jgi:hypothetical protein
MYGGPGPQWPTGRRQGWSGAGQAAVSSASEQTIQVK